MSVLPSKEPKSTPTTKPSVELDIEGRTRDLGDGFTVRRFLPSAARRMVGPFIFLDHMGPVQLAPRHGLDVRPHPHINLATVTYLFDGEILHRDSLGSEQSIRPGAVNWMTAERGIVHSERSPAVARKTGGRVHGLKLWVALPTTAEEVEPTCRHQGAGHPAVERKGARLRVVAGSADGATSPVQVLSPLFSSRPSLTEPPSCGCRTDSPVARPMWSRGRSPATGTRMGRARCSSSAPEPRCPSFIFAPPA